MADRPKDGVLVTTVMSNLGLHIAMKDAGVEVRTVGVGDRYVLEELRRADIRWVVNNPGTS